MNSIKKNFAYNLIYQVFTILMPLITAPYLARIVGVAGLGMYSYTFTVAEYFVYFALLGVANYGNRTIAGSSAKTRSHIFVNIYAVQISVSSIMVFAYIIFSVFINKKYEFLTYIQTLYVVSAALDVTWYFFGTEKFKLTTLRNAAVKLISLIAIFVFVKSSDDVWKYTFIMASSYLLSQAIMWVYIVKEIQFEKPILSEMIVHLKPMLILFIPVIAVTLYKMMDKIMLEAMASVNDVGFYESAEKIVRVPSLVISALGTSMLPRMSKLSANGNKDKMIEYFSISIDFSGFLTFGMVFGLTSVAYFLIPIYYGSGFEYSIILMELLSITLIFTSWANAIRTQYLLPLKHDREYIMSVFSGAIVNLILNIILIPDIGAKGAVIATIAAEASVALIQTYGVKKEISVLTYLKKYMVYLIPGIIMYIILHLLLTQMKRSLFNLIVLVLCGTFVYSFAAIIMMAITHSELFEIGKRIVKAHKVKR